MMSNSFVNLLLAKYAALITRHVFRFEAHLLLDAVKFAYTLIREKCSICLDEKLVLLCISSDSELNVTHIWVL